MLRSLPEDVVASLLSDAVTRRYSRGETLFLHGEKAQSIHIVLDGWVKLYRVGPNGNEAVVNVFTRGHSFGEAVAFRGLDYPVSAEAVKTHTAKVSGSGRSWSIAAEGTGPGRRRRAQIRPGSVSPRRAARAGAPG